MAHHESSDDDHHLARCPLCGGASLHRRFVAQGTPIDACTDCGLLTRNPQPSDVALAGIYDEAYFLGSDSPRSRQLASGVKQATARLYLDRLATFQRPGTTRLLEVGCGNGELLLEADRRGYAITGIELSPTTAAMARRLVPSARVLCGDLASLRLTPASYDVCILADVVEHVRQPVALLTSVRRLLAPGGTVFIVTPSLDSWSSRILRRHWMEFKLEHLHYFSRATVTRLLVSTGFGDVTLFAGSKILTLQYLLAHFERFPVPLMTHGLRGAMRLVPARISRYPVRLYSAGILALARVPSSPHQPAAAP